MESKYRAGDVERNSKNFPRDFTGTCFEIIDLFTPYVCYDLHYYTIEPLNDKFFCYYCVKGDIVGEEELKEYLTQENLLLYGK